MRQRHEVKALRQVAAIRALQQAVAKAGAARAAGALLEREEALAERERNRDSAAGDWQAALDARSLPIETIPLWSAALLRADAAVRDAGRVADAARADLDDSKHELHAADRRNEVAAELVRKSVRDRQARREETAVQRAAELHLQRRGGR